MYNFYIVDVVTGEIDQIIKSTTAIDDHYVDDGFEIRVGVADQLTQYVHDNALISRPAQSIAVSVGTITADGVDAAVFTGIVAGSKISVDVPTNAQAIADFTLSGTTLTFNAVVAGPYEFTITLFPYITFRIIVVAE